jgi:hypothetical protein
MFSWVSRGRSEGRHMERKAGGSTAEVAAAEVRAALGGARTLSSEEEKALRMRHGGFVQRDAPLPRAAAGNAELEDELLVVEMQLMRAWRRRMAAATTAPAPSRTKDKIVRALRKKR